jgi:hypothetical protein
VKPLIEWIVWTCALVGSWVYGGAARSWWEGAPASFPASWLWFAPLFTAALVWGLPWLLRRLGVKEGGE